MHTGASRSIDDIGVGDVCESPEHQALALAVSGKLRAVLAQMKRHDRAAKRRTGLTVAQLWAIARIEAQPGIGVSELARQLDIHLSTASNMLDPLEQGGYVERRRIATDHRVVQLHLSDKGRAVLGDPPKPVRSRVRNALQELSHEHLAALNGALDELIGRLGVTRQSDTPSRPDEP